MRVTVRRRSNLVQSDSSGPHMRFDNMAVSLLLCVLYGSHDVLMKRGRSRPCASVFSAAIGGGALPGQAYRCASVRHSILMRPSNVYRGVSAHQEHLMAPASACGFRLFLSAPSFVLGAEDDLSVTLPAYRPQRISTFTVYLSGCRCASWGRSSPDLQTTRASARMSNTGHQPQLCLFHSPGNHKINR